MRTFLLVMIGSTILVYGDTKTDTINDEIKLILPETSDAKLNRILSSADMFYYNTDIIKKAHQDWEGATQGILDSRYNISASKNELYGNANIEFPWGTPAGMHLNKNSGSYKFIYLPRDKNNKLLPIVYFKGEIYSYGVRTLKDGSLAQRNDLVNTNGWSWMFPNGAIVGEILFITHEKNKYIFEIRTRTRQIDKWVSNVYRPFPTSADLLNALKQQPQSADVVALSEHLKTKELSKPVMVADTQPDREVFRQMKSEDYLPPLNDIIVIKLLRSTTFSSALGTTWRGSGEYAPHAPTTNSEFHIVPKDYKGGHIEVSSKSCMRCHSGTNLHVDEFDVRRDWYGRVRGSDGIFSFHIFDNDDIKFKNVKDFRFNKKLIDAGIIAEYNQSIHDKSIYAKINDLK